MNAYGYYLEMTETEEEAPTMFTSAVIESVMKAKTPNVINATLRKESRKEWAKQARSLFKTLGIKGVSVTTPSYSMASSINISANYEKEWHTAHTPVHVAGEAAERDSNAPYRGSTHFCPYCKARKEVHDKIEDIVLSAFPDLNDKSDSQSDYFDFCLSINY